MALLKSWSWQASRAISSGSFHMSLSRLETCSNQDAPVSFGKVPPRNPLP